MKSGTALCLLFAVTTLPPPTTPLCIPPYAGSATCVTPYRPSPQLCRPLVTYRPVPPPPVPAPIIVTVPPPPPQAPLRIYVRPSPPSPPKIPRIVVLPPPPPVHLPAVIWLQPLSNKPWGPCVPVRAWDTATPGVFWGVPCPPAVTTPCNPQLCSSPC